MKKVEAVIRHHKLEEVKNELAERDVAGVTVTEVRGFGRQRGHREIFRGTEYVVDFVPKLKLDIACRDDQLETVMEVLQRVARTGQVGDGKFFVIDLGDAIRIRTGEKGELAL